MIKYLLALLTLTLSVSTQAAMINLVASLDGGQEVPPVATAGAGSGTMTLDDVSNELTWMIEWSGLSDSATAGHFHGPAAPGNNAGVEVPLDISNNPTAGNVILTDDQEADLLAGLWYINIHTAANPGGEIRGQVNVIPLPAAAWLFATAMLGLAAVRRARTWR